MHVVPEVTGDAGCCVISGAANDPYGFVRTEHVIDPRRTWGEAHVAGSIVREMGEAVGMLCPEKFELIESERDAYKERISELEREIDGLEHENTALSSAVRTSAARKSKPKAKAAA